MSQAAALAASQSAPSPKCQDVEARQKYTWNVELSRFGDYLVGKWSGFNMLEPDHAHIAFFLGSERIAIQQLGKAQGELKIQRGFGPGYRVAIIARNFSGQDVEVVSTNVSGTELPPPAKKSYEIRVALGKNAKNNAQLTYNWDGPFRPRESQYSIFEQGQDPRTDWINEASRSFDTGIRWGVGLAAAYTAEDYEGGRREVVRTPTTKSLDV